MNFIWFVFGLILLVVGAQFLVRGTSKLALSFGVSPLVAGLTIVAFGLSVGGALVGSVFAASHFAAVPMAEFMILPLMGIYYVLAGLLGQSPLALVDEAMHNEPALPAVVRKVAARRRAGQPICLRAHTA